VRLSGLAGEVIRNHGGVGGTGEAAHLDEKQHQDTEHSDTDGEADESDKSVCEELALPLPSPSQTSSAEEVASTSRWQRHCRVTVRCIGCCRQHRAWACDVQELGNQL
jgi:hypothetical protein